MVQRRGAFTAELAGRPGPSEEERQRQASYQQELRGQVEEQRRAREAEKQREKERDRLVRLLKKLPPPFYSMRRSTLMRSMSQDEERYMRDLATSRSEGGADTGANRSRARRADPNAQSGPSGLPGGLSADSSASTYGFGAAADVGTVKPARDGRQAGHGWDSGGHSATNATQHAPQAQPRGSFGPAGGDSTSGLLGSMRLGGGGAVHSAPGGLGLEHTWGRAAAIDVGNLLGSSSGTSELDSMFDGLLAEQRQLKAERRRSSGVASAPSSFARGLGSPSVHGRWGSTQRLGSTQTRRRWGAAPLGTTSSFGPRATRGLLASGGYGGTPQPGGGYSRYGGYNGYAGGVRSAPRRRRTFDAMGRESPGFGLPVPYRQDGFSPLGSDGGLPPPVHVSQEAARAHRRPPYQQPPASQHGRFEDQQGFDYTYDSPRHAVHQPHYGQPQQLHTQGQYESPAGTDYYYHEHHPEQQHMQQEQLQEDTRHGDELGQTSSSRFLDHDESEQYLDHV